MRIGLSTYSLDREIEAGRMTLGGVLDWIAAHGGECAELVPFAYRFDDVATGDINNLFIQDTVRRAKDAGIALSNYSILADLCKEGEAFEAEVKRICHHVDIAAALGVPYMRHDVSAFRRPHEQNGVADFEQMLPHMVDGMKAVAAYARARGVTTLVENHGFFANGCDRVERLLLGAGDAGGLLLDTGNIVCVDEDAVVAARRLAPHARVIHLKDFYIRARDPGDSTLFDCGGKWFCSHAGRYLRGAIFGQGDLDVWTIGEAIQSAGYDGDIMIEFEGLEDALYASEVAMGNARRVFARG